MVDNEDFIAYTPNRFLMSQYALEVRELGGPDMIDVYEYECESEDEFLENLDIQVGVLFGHINKRRKLFSISDHNSDSIFVLPKLLYDLFIDDFIRYGEIAKRVGFYYRHFNLRAVNLYNYISPEYSDIFIPLSQKIIDEYYPKLKEFQIINKHDLISELYNRDNCTLWDVLNEYTEVYNYFKVAINTTDFNKIKKRVDF
jgi:hypothetical protein